MIKKAVFGFFIVGLAALGFHEIQKTTKLNRMRTTNDAFHKTDGKTPPSREGMEGLNISGSHSPSKYALLRAFYDKDMPVYVYALLGESHYYINGLPEKLFGYHYNDKVGTFRKERSVRATVRSILYTGKLEHDVKDIQTEKQIVEDIGFNYIGCDQERYEIFTPEHVDEFITTVQALPKPSWIHFHCNGGRGRTSMAMVMYDIMHNGKKVPLEDIVRRQHLLGSEDLFDVTVWEHGSYSKEMLVKRKWFVERFYEYVNDPHGFGHLTWQQWIKKHGYLYKNM